MAVKGKPSWGELNVALNVLVKEGVVLTYSASAGNNGSLLVEVTIDKGADQADVVRRVREALPATFSEAQVRTRTV